MDSNEAEGALSANVSRLDNHVPICVHANVKFDHYSLPIPYSVQKHTLVVYFVQYSCFILF